MTPEVEQFEGLQQAFPQFLSKKTNMGKIEPLSQNLVLFNRSHLN
jgi:hypothetical protein